MLHRLWLSTMIMVLLSGGINAQHGTTSAPTSAPTSKSMFPTFLTPDTPKTCESWHKVQLTVRTDKGPKNNKFFWYSKDIETTNSEIIDKVTIPVWQFPSDGGTYNADTEYSFEFPVCYSNQHTFIATDEDQEGLGPGLPISCKVYNGDVKVYDNNNAWLLTDWLVKRNVAVTYAPTTVPSLIPSTDPSSSPTLIPSDVPSVSPFASPSAQPSDNPSVSPSKEPTEDPSATPTDIPSFEPSDNPTHGKYGKKKKKPKNAHGKFIKKNPKKKARTNSPTDSPTKKGGYAS